MSDTSLNSRQDGWYNPGDRLILTCSKRGEAVKGFFSSTMPDSGFDNLWYETPDAHFVADVDIETQTPGVVAAPACGPDGPAAGSPQVPTGSGTSYTTRVEDFVTTTAGKQIGDGQCVALVKKYLGDVYGITDGGWGDAIAYKNGGIGGNQLESRGFSWHTDQNFTNGDILVWSSASSPQGHVAIWYDGKVFDQNYDGRLTAGSDPFSAYGYEGYWRKA